MSEHSKSLTIFDGGCDLVVFVDDWKGAESGKPTGPVSFMGRSYKNADRQQVRRLQRILRQNSAEKWHASAGRSINTSLFLCPDFDQILKHIDRLDSDLFISMHEVSDFSLEWVKSEWLEIREKSEEIGRFWPRDNVYAMGLARYLYNLFVWLVKYWRPSSTESLHTLVVTDRMDWVKQRPGSNGSAMQEVPYFSSLIENMRFDIRMVMDKESEESREYLYWLGLVDSECWGLARLQTREFEDGTNIREKMLDWKDRGCPEEVTASDPEVLKALTDENPKLIRYLNQIKNWWEPNERVHRVNNPEYLDAVARSITDETTG